MLFVVVAAARIRPLFWSVLKKSKFPMLGWNLLV